MKKILFICSQNRLRSPTAEQVFASWPGVETDSAGLDAEGTQRLDGEQVRWADFIFVMERSHKNKLSKRFGEYLRGKRVVCLDIPDDYEYMDPGLVELLRVKVGAFLR